MKNGFEILAEQKFLVYSLITIGFIFLVANLFEQERHPITENLYLTDILYYIIPVIGIILGILVSVKYRTKGNHGKAWILLTLAMVSWYVGELTFIYENEYDIEDITSFASDIFYILGYPLLFGFAVFYLKPRKKIISKQIILAASVVPIALMIPSLYISFDLEEETLEPIEVFIVVIYPVLDAIVLAPSLVGIILFFRGEVNLLWTLMIIGLLCDVTGDTLYLGSYIDNSYYPGHISDMFYLWGYLLFAFGFYSHLKLYKRESVEKLEN